MAEDFWLNDPTCLNMPLPSKELVQECKRLSESCLYTSTSLFIWLRWLRIIRMVFIIVPLIAGTLASGKFLAGGTDPVQKWIAAVCAFLAGVLPTVYAALKFDRSLSLCTELAAEFKDLQDRFRQAALISARKGPVEFEKHFNQVMKRLEAARKPSYTAPEWCFREAQRKIKGGDYDFDVDIAAGGGNSAE